MNKKWWHYLEGATTLYYSRKILIVFLLPILYCLIFAFSTSMARSEQDMLRNIKSDGIEGKLLSIPFPLGTPKQEIIDKLGTEATESPEPNLLIYQQDKLGEDEVDNTVKFYFESKTNSLIGINIRGLTVKSMTCDEDYLIEILGKPQFISDSSWSSIEGTLYKTFQYAIMNPTTEKTNYLIFQFPLYQRTTDLTSISLWDPGFKMPQSFFEN